MSSATSALVSHVKPEGKVNYLQFIERHLAG